MSAGAHPSALAAQGALAVVRGSGGGRARSPPAPRVPPPTTWARWSFHRGTYQLIMMTCVIIRLTRPKHDEHSQKSRLNSWKDYKQGF